MAIPTPRELERAAQLALIAREHDAALQRCAAAEARSLRLDAQIEQLARGEQRLGIRRHRQLRPLERGIRSQYFALVVTLGARLGADAVARFKRIMRPQGVALPIINLSVWLSRSGDTSRPSLSIAAGK